MLVDRNIGNLWNPINFYERKPVLSGNKTLDQRFGASLKKHFTANFFSHIVILDSNLNSDCPFCKHNLGQGGVHFLSFAKSKQNKNILI